MALKLAFGALIPRQLRDNNEEDEEDSCRSYEEDTHAEPLTGDMTLHDLLTYLTAACMGISVIVGIILVVSHFRNYYQPRAQRQTIRMILMMPIFTILSFISVISYRAEPYLTPLIELYEVFALVAAFYLLLVILTPEAKSWQDQLAWFSQPENGGRKAFRRSYICVTQLLPGFFITTILSLVITGADCYGGDNYSRASIAISVLGKHLIEHPATRTRANQHNSESQRYASDIFTTHARSVSQP
jgi:hypothetical protein